MNYIHIANTNQKGQIVIPAKMRKELGITEHVPLQIKLTGNEILISPVTQVITGKQHSDESYLELLRRTRGSWADDPAFSQEERKKRREIELKETEKNKKAW